MKKKYKEEDLPCYEILIDDYDNTGIRFVSIVGEPAIEMMGMMFGVAQEAKQFDFKEVKDKQIIVGPAMIPNKKILRKDDDGNAYTVVFSKETILQMVQKFNANGNNRRINIDHSKQMVDGYIAENWVVEDSYYDKSRMYGFEVPVGTWMVVVKIEDEKFWQDEVRGQGKYGFSVEGMMNQKPMGMSIDKVIDGLSEDDIIQLFADVNEELLFEYMSKTSKDKGDMQFVDISQIDIPETQWVYMFEGPLDEKTRPMCQHLLKLDKYWSHQDIMNMSDALGYNFEKWKSGINCRHELKRYGIHGKINHPTASQIDSVASDQSPTMKNYLD